MISQSQLKELLNYNHDNGIFTWRISPNWSIRVGDAAGSVNWCGYICIGIRGRLYMAHRLAWLYMTGKWPENDTDHINGVEDDNRFKNLRELSHSANMQNLRRAYKNNATGVLGVTKHAGKFYSRININGVSRHLGTYPTAELAHIAYLEAKREFHTGGTL